MKGIVFEIVSILLIVACLYFFYRSTQFLVERDYLASALTVVIGFTLAKVSVDLARLAAISRKED